MVSILSKTTNNNNWLKIHYNHRFHVHHDNINSIIKGDSIVAGLTRYNNVWKNLFGNGFINLGIRGDRAEHVLWRVRDIAFPPRLKNVVILCGTNNINKDPPIILFKDWLPLIYLSKADSINLTYLFVDYFPADETNDLLSFKCSVNNFHYIDHKNIIWTGITCNKIPL